MQWDTAQIHLVLTFEVHSDSTQEMSWKWELQNQTNKQRKNTSSYLTRVRKKKPAYSTSTGKPLDESIPLWRGEKEKLLTPIAKWNSDCLTGGYAHIGLKSILDLQWLKWQFYSPMSNWIKRSRWGWGGWDKKGRHNKPFQTQNLNWNFSPIHTLFDYQWLNV